MTVVSRAQVSAIERLVMPGPVTEAHADIESECASCHVRFSRGQQRELCMDCHENIASDLEAKSGFHGRSPAVGQGRCVDCHTEHEGRGADIVGLVPTAFDHELTDFPLRDSHRDEPCESCHADGKAFHEAPTDCYGCHAEDDRHMGNLGRGCADCHSETHWSDARFDHESTGYSLTGAHADVSCSGCHVAERYQDTPTRCAACHRQDDVHEGANGEGCQSCHTTADWSEVLFDHLESTGFALAGGHSGLMCEDCHQGNKLEENTPTQCHGCHADDDVHEGTNGTACADCHAATDWKDVRFDHADTGFALNGAHADLMCAQCHTAPVDAYTPPSDCHGCHAADDPHRSQLGEDCAACHGETGWTEDLRFDHDLAAFPLLGKHAQVDCDGCHETEAFLDAPGQCIDCHSDDDAHRGGLGPACEDCHNPVDWLLWQFDHGKQTRFVLDGAHAGLACEGCHRKPVSSAADIAVPMTCGSCHRGDDVHRGAFGSDCADCHATESFEEVRAVR
jgi:hypothetical protein